MRIVPKGLSEIPQVPGYSPIGLAMNFEYFPIEPGKEVEVPLPFTNTQITNGTECFMVIRKNDSCDIVLPTSVHPGYLTVTVDSTVKSVILVQKGMSHGSAVAYLDGGMIYSHDNGTSIRTNIVLRNCLPGYVDSALMKVYYTDISDPFNPVNDSVLFPFDTVKVAEGYLLETRDMVRFAGAVRVNKITLDIPNVYISFMDSTTHNVSRGQSLVFNCDWDIDYFSSIPKPVSASYDINYALESVSIDGDGRILQHRTGDSVTYSYDFYLKDHLGSTRMVFNDQQSVTEKINYQSYGTINPLDSSSPALPSREKFTGKEFDTQGADFARVEFDVAVREFDMSTGSGFIRVGYRDVATGNEFSKIYMARYDSKNNALRYTGSESFTGEIEIVRMFMMASGEPGGIFNIVPIDSFLVSLGKTRKIQLDVASSEIVGAPIDTNFYSVHASVDNRSYFSGTRLFYFGARYYDPELGLFTSTDPIADSRPQMPSLQHRLPPGMRLAALIGEEDAARVMGEIEASGYDPQVIASWQQKILSNPYNYCFNNPINFFDPDGKWGLGHFFKTFFQEFKHQIKQAFKEIGIGLIDIGSGIANTDGDQIGEGFGSLFKGIGRRFGAKIEAAGAAAYSVMPDIENYAHGEHSHTKLAQFLRWAGVGSGGAEKGAHGGSAYYDEYTNMYKDDVKSKNPFKRWRAKGHLAHTAQDAHIHRNDWWTQDKREEVFEGLDWLPIIWIPSIFITDGDYERTIYEY